MSAADFGALVRKVLADELTDRAVIEAVSDLDGSYCSDAFDVAEHVADGLRNHAREPRDRVEFRAYLVKAAAQLVGAAAEMDREDAEAKASAKEGAA